jgi:hypothetical protein
VVFQDNEIKFPILTDLNSFTAFVGAGPRACPGNFQIPDLRRKQNGTPQKRVPSVALLGYSPHRGDTFSPFPHPLFDHLLPQKIPGRMAAE